ncbi:hypothetical protein [Salipiger bermudensis]|uniref:hypothetical protein n=1 Tax=Salipiger TaxID=263377 RepID=UPI00399085E1
MTMRARLSLFCLALTALASCAETAPEPDAPFVPVYEGVETRLLDGDLVNFFVQMHGARDASDVEDYARCAAAQYALIRGYGFARHLRTNVAQEGGLWRGDAVYTISAALPAGLKTIDAEVVASACAENEIPMV